MTIHDAYTRWAARYDSDRNLTRDLDRAMTAEVLGPLRFALTIEAGCGTGKNTAFFASISESVLALDFSAGMLEQARGRITEKHVRFQQADLNEPWPCAAAVFDLVSCNLVLEHIADISHFFRQAARALAPRGIFFVSELHPCRQYRGSQARFVDDHGRSIQIAAYTHSLSDFLRAAAQVEFQLERLDEWWHEEDAGKPPRLISFLFRKRVENQAAP